MADKKSMRVDATAVTEVVVDAAKKQAWAIASRIAAQDGHTPEEIRTIAKSAAVATEQALAKVAKSAASASAARRQRSCPAHQAPQGEQVGWRFELSGAIGTPPCLGDE